MLGSLDDALALPDRGGPSSPGLGRRKRVRSLAQPSPPNSAIDPSQSQFDWSPGPPSGTPETPSPPPVAPSPRAKESLGTLNKAKLSPALPVLKRSLRETVERFLRERGIPYINVDEAKRALFNGAKLRSFHFVVYQTTAKNWLVWAAQLRKESREDMEQWQEIFGDGFVAVVAKQVTDGTLQFRTLAGETIDLT